MLVFVDESGDTGLKCASGSSSYFVVALVLFEDHEEANRVDEAIASLKHDLGLPGRYEFHFSSCQDEYRTRFLNVVQPYGFRYFGMVIDKRYLKGEGFKYPESFYKFTSRLVFENAQELLEDAVVVVDGSGSKQFRIQLANYLTHHINTGEKRCIRKISLRDSSKNNLIQLADMVAGALARSFTLKSGGAEYRKLLERQESRVSIWPKGK